MAYSDPANAQATARDINRKYGVRVYVYQLTNGQYIARMYDQPAPRGSTVVEYVEGNRPYPVGR